jgi:mycoredoxin
MAEKVVVYSSSYCRNCKALRRFLEEHQVPFEEVNVEEAMDRFLPVAQATGQQVLPTVDVDGQYLVNPSLKELAGAVGVDA